MHGLEATTVCLFQSHSKKIGKEPREPAGPDNHAFWKCSQEIRPAVIKYWKANMDIQFVLNAMDWMPVYTVVYITSYVWKGKKDLSDLLADVADENTDISVR